MVSRRVRIGIVQMKMSDELDENIQTALAGVEEASRKGAEIVCLPELFAWKYFPTTRSSRQTPETIPGRVSGALS